MKKQTQKKGIKKVASYVLLASCVSAAFLVIPTFLGDKAYYYYTKIKHNKEN